jgi:hypothetical protein
MAMVVVTMMMEDKGQILRNTHQYPPPHIPLRTHCGIVHNEQEINSQLAANNSTPYLQMPQGAQFSFGHS